MFASVFNSTPQPNMLQVQHLSGMPWRLVPRCDTGVLAVIFATSKLGSFEICYRHGAAAKQGAEVYHNLKSVIKKKYGQECLGAGQGDTTRLKEMKILERFPNASTCCCCCCCCGGGGRRCCCCCCRCRCRCCCCC